MSNQRKITVTRPDGTSVTIEDHGETDLSRLLEPKADKKQPRLRRWKFTAAPVLGPVHVPTIRVLGGWSCPTCGTLWPSAWFGIYPPCNCYNTQPTITWGTGSASHTVTSTSIPTLTGFSE